MSATTINHFDVLEYVKKAKELGTTEALAEFQARQIEHAIDLAVVSIESREITTKQDLSELKLELIKWILGTGAATILALAGLLKYMH